jgi:hypothetical protein
LVEILRIGQERSKHEIKVVEKWKSSNQEKEKEDEM